MRNPFYIRINYNVIFIWPSAAYGVDLDGRYFFEVAFLYFAVGLA